jgi:choline dehydrogenase-like flavoprotein
MHDRYDVIIIGSGAGGSAAAYHLTQTGKRVLLLEKGQPLPRDGSTLDPDAVLKRGLFLNDEPWVDALGRTILPEEHFNVGGKTKWYGAALLRFGAHEFAAEDAHRCLPWPISYDDLAPYYDEAERLLDLRQLPIEPNLQAIAEGLARRDPRWRRKPMPVGLAADIIEHRREAQHFDGFASAGGFKSDAEQCLLARLRNKPNFVLEAGRAVKALVPTPDTPTRLAGVVCEDGSRYAGDAVFLACGALHSPRLLQTYLETTGLHNRLACYARVGRNYKAHLLSLVIAFSARPVTDLLCKTALILHESFPHSSVQAIGGNLAEEIIYTQMPRRVPRALAGVVARRAYGLFLQTEDGSHPDNRILASAGGSGLPQIDYDPARLPEAAEEHRRLRETLVRQLRALGYLAVARAIPITGTAHACGTLVAGHDPATSVVDAEGRVHGLDNCYVVDGSVLPRSSRVNPALTIYAWALRAASRLGAKGFTQARVLAGAEA